MNKDFREKAKIFSVINRHLQDDVSRTIFANRYFYNMTLDLGYMRNIFQVTYTQQKNFCDVLKDKKGVQKIIFGAGKWGGWLKDNFPNEDWKYYVDNHPKKNKEHGLDVIGFTEFKARYNGEYIIIATRKFYHEIEQQLLKEGFLQKNIFVLGEVLDSLFNATYFDLPQLPKEKDEVFVDVGGFDGFTSLKFCEWSQENYSKIYVFEPIEKLIYRCKKNLKDVQRCELIGKGLWNTSTVLKFVSDEYNSKIVTANDSNKTASIPVTTLDEELKGERVTFIKMDIEGSELMALKGAENIIRSQKPKLALSIYHKPEDLWEIPMLLLEYNPKYKFYIRHYSLSWWDTVLYAF